MHVVPDGHTRSPHFDDPLFKHAASTNAKRRSVGLMVSNSKFRW
jgi:hypothetical protein